MDGTKVTGPDDRLSSCVLPGAADPSSAPHSPSERVAVRNDGDVSRSDYQPLVIVAIAAAAGITVDRQVDSTAFAVWTALGVCCLIAWWILGCTARNRAAAWLLVMAAAFTGGSWHHLRWDRF